MTIYLYGNTIDDLIPEGELVPLELSLNEDNSDFIIKGHGLTITNYAGEICNENGNVYDHDELYRLVLLEQARRIFLKLQNSGMLDDFNESMALSNISFVVAVENGSIDDTTATEHIGAFSPWAAGIDYAEGNIRSYNDKLYRCVQAHTSQVDWTPDVSASLWTAIGDPAQEWPQWSQPVGAHDAYMTGDKVTHNDIHWISTVDNNIWEPGVYGWEQSVD